MREDISFTEALDVATTLDTTLLVELLEITSEDILEVFLGRFIEHRWKFVEYEDAYYNAVYLEEGDPYECE